MTELSADWLLPIDGPPIEGGCVRYENGRIVEIGTHDELIHHGGIYNRLHELQYLDVGAGIDV